MKIKGISEPHRVGIKPDILFQRFTGDSFKIKQNLKF